MKYYITCLCDKHLNSNLYKLQFIIKKVLFIGELFHLILDQDLDLLHNQKYHVHCVYMPCNQQPQS